jgi:hypothetical protein
LIIKSKLSSSKQLKGLLPEREGSLSALHDLVACAIEGATEITVLTTMALISLHVALESPPLLSIHCHNQDNGFSLSPFTFAGLISKGEEGDEEVEKAGKIQQQDYGRSAWNLGMR